METELERLGETVFETVLDMELETELDTEFDTELETELETETETEAVCVRLIETEGGDDWEKTPIAEAKRTIRHKTTRAFIFLFCKATLRDVWYNSVDAKS